MRRASVRGRGVGAIGCFPTRAPAVCRRARRAPGALAAALQQANIVPLLAAGATAEGPPYYTMPFVDGLSLRAQLERNGALPVGEAVSVLRDVARAHSYAHERGVVHRDVTPENVLLSGGAAVVTDFGIAKALSASTTQAPDGRSGGTLTQLGTSLGTPAYLIAAVH